jgi:lysozyme
MILERLINQLKYDEGFRSEPYKCSADVWTIGYGTTHVDGQKVNENWLPITKDMAEDWLFAHVAGAIRRAKRFANNFDRLNHERQEALVNMAYQLGNRLFKFVKARKAIQNQQWDRAYNELKNSLWYQQTTKRAERVAQAFLT